MSDSRDAVSRQLGEYKKGQKVRNKIRIVIQTNELYLIEIDMRGIEVCDVGQCDLLPRTGFMFAQR